MSRQKELTKSTLSILASQSVSTLIAIAFIVYFARVFSKEQMAVYAIMSMFAGWTELVGGLGMGTMMEKDVAHLIASDREERAKQLISSIFIYRTMAMTVITVMFYVFCPFINDQVFGSAGFLEVIRFTVIISLFMTIASTISCIQVSVQRFQSRAAIDVVTVLSQRGLCVIGFILFGIYGFFTGYLVATIGGAVASFFDVKRYFTLQLIPFREIFRESKSYFGLVMLKGAADKVDGPAIALFLGAEVLAGYHVAKRLYDNLYGIIQAIVVPAGVKFGEVMAEGGEAVQAFYKKTMNVVAQAFIPMGFFVILVAKPILYVYGGEKYVASSNILAAFGFTLMAVALWFAMRAAALRLISPRHLAYQYIVTSAVTLLGYALLLPHYGVVGIPIAMGLGYFAGLIPVAIQLKKQWRIAVPIKDFGLSFGCGACVFAVAVPVSFVQGLSAQLALASVLSVVVYLSWHAYFGVGYKALMARR